jgi:hypothetical protein
MKRRLILYAAEIAGLVALHAALLHWLAERDVVSVIFSAGQHTPFWMMASAGGFLLVRLLVLLFLPGMVLNRLVMFWLETRQRSRASAKPPRH